MAGRLWVSAALFPALWLGLMACGDDDGSRDAASGSGCTTDVECKGDRVCESGMCVDPTTGAPDGERDGGAGAGAGSGGGDRGDAGDLVDAGSSAGNGGSGAAGSGGQSGSAGRPAIDDPALEEACSLSCEARKAAACEMDIGTLDQCLAQCLIVDETSDGYCHDEQRVHYACLASGGYSCISGYPQQKATCTAESIALAQCNQGAPCRAFCDLAAGQCAPSGDACLTACNDMQAGFDDAICGIYYTQLLSCWNRNGACEGEVTALEPCRAEVSGVADCIASRSEECEGFCWAADQLGCGSSDCVETCQPKTEHPSCGSYYRQVIDCTLGSRELFLDCEGGEPTPDAVECASSLMQWETCMGM